MLATAAISTQLVVDLGGVYGQNFSTAQAKELATTLATQLMKLGLVELSTQTLNAALKTSALTFVAGGLLQGLSAAYLTRVAGFSLVEFYEQQARRYALSPTPAANAVVPTLEQLQPLLSQAIQTCRQGENLQRWVQHGRQILQRQSGSAVPSA